AERRPRGLPRHLGLRPGLADLPRRGEWPDLAGEPARPAPRRAPGRLLRPGEANMTAQVRLTLFAILVTAVGCNRPSATVAPAGGAAPAAGDYRTMSKAQLQDFVKSKIGVEEVTL